MPAGPKNFRRTCGEKSSGLWATWPVRLRRDSVAPSYETSSAFGSFQIFVMQEGSRRGRQECATFISSAVVSIENDIGRQDVRLRNGEFDNCRNWGTAQIMCHERTAFRSKPLTWTSTVGYKRFQSTHGNTSRAFVFAVCIACSW